MKENKKRIVFISPRYGLEVTGGAEAECRAYAEHLTEKYEVDVLTTCAKDHLTWENYYPSGTEEINGVHVIRFPTERNRDLEKFSEVMAQTYHQEIGRKEELYFVDEQGPFCPALVKYIEDHTEEYSVFVFVTYLYYHTVYGIERVRNKSILIPTLHDEWVAYLKIYQEVFQQAAGFIYNTEEEKAFADSLFKGTKKKPFCIAGYGIDQPDLESIPDVKKRFGIDRYILYAGRIDEGKGCLKLFEYFEKYKHAYNDSLKLVLCGKEGIPIPQNSEIISLGFVSEEEKAGLMKNAVLLVMPSPYESLSIVVLEALMLKTPVLVNGESPVLKAHCVKSNGGLYYTDYREFEMALLWMLAHPDARMTMGENGRNYVLSNYQWDTISNKISDLISEVQRIAQKQESNSHKVTVSETTLQNFTVEDSDNTGLL